MDRAAAEREFAVDVVRRLRDAGHQALLGRRLRARRAARPGAQGLRRRHLRPSGAVAPLFRRTMAVGKSFGVIEVLRHRRGDKPLNVQVATFRSDVAYTDGRRPDQVVFCSAREDALRRDFTINGMFFDPLTDQILDYVGGREDLAARVLRAIGDPAQRFERGQAAHAAGRPHGQRGSIWRSTRPPQDAIRAMAPTTHGGERRAHRRRAAQDAGPPPSGRGHASVPRPRPGRPGAAGIAADARAAAGAAARRRPRPAAARPTRPGQRRRRHRRPVGTRAARAGTAGPRAIVPAGLRRLAPRRRQAAHRRPDPRPLHLPLATSTSAGAWRREICLRLRTVQRRARADRVAGREAPGPVRRAGRCAPASSRRCWSTPASANCWTCTAPTPWPATAASTTWSIASGCWPNGPPSDLNPEPLFTGHDLMRMGLEPGPLYKRLLDAVREAQLEGTVTNAREARGAGGTAAAAN